MPYKTVTNIITVWLANGIAWIIALNPEEWIGGLQLIKEIVALISLLIAIGYTLYKWRQSWNGIDPKKKYKEEDSDL